MPIVLLPGEETPRPLPPNRLRELVDQGQRVVLPDFDVALYRHTDDPDDGGGVVYKVEPIDADYVEAGVQDHSVDNSSMAEEFDTFDEALEAATA
jgi:hypothetical protein